MKHVSRRMNEEANSLALASTGLKLSPGTLSKAVPVQKRLLPSIRRRGLGLEVFLADPLEPTIEDGEMVKNEMIGVALLFHSLKIHVPR